MMLFPAASW